MLLIPDPNLVSCSIRSPKSPRSVMIADVIDPVTKQRYDRDPRYIARKAELYLERIGRGRYGVLRGGGGVLHFRQRPLRSARSSTVSTSLTPKKGGGIPGAWRTIWAIVRATRKATSRCRPPTTTRICAARWCVTMQNAGIDGGVPPSRSGDRQGRRRSTCSFDSLVKSADNMLLYKYIVQERRQPVRQDRDVHAEADLR